MKRYLLLCALFNMSLYTSKPKKKIMGPSSTAIAQSLKPLVQQTITAPVPYINITSSLQNQWANRFLVSVPQIERALEHIVESLEKANFFTRGGKSKQGKWINGLAPLYNQSAVVWVQQRIMQTIVGKQKIMQAGVFFLVPDKALSSLSSHFTARKGSLLQAFNNHIVKLTVKIAQQERLNFDDIYVLYDYLKQLSKEKDAFLIVHPSLYGPSLAQIAAIAIARNDEVSRLLVRILLTLNLESAFPVVMPSAYGKLGAHGTSLWAVTLAYGAPETARLFIKDVNSAQKIAQSPFDESTTCLERAQMIFTSTESTIEQQAAAQWLLQALMPEPIFQEPAFEFEWEPSDTFDMLSKKIDSDDVDQMRLLQEFDKEMEFLSFKMSHGQPFSTQDIYNLRGHINKLGDSASLFTAQTAYGPQLANIAATAMNNNVGGVSGLVNTLIKTGFDPRTPIIVPSLKEEGKKVRTSLLSLALEKGDKATAAILLKVPDILKTPDIEPTMGMPEAAVEEVVPPASTQEAVQESTYTESKTELPEQPQQSEGPMVSIEEQAKEILHNGESTEEQKQVAQLILDTAEQQKEKEALATLNLVPEPLPSEETTVSPDESFSRAPQQPPSLQEATSRLEHIEQMLDEEEKEREEGAEDDYPRASVPIVAKEEPHEKKIEDEELPPLIPDKGPTPAPTTSSLFNPHNLKKAGRGGRLLFWVGQKTGLIDPSSSSPKKPTSSE